MKLIEGKTIGEVYETLYNELLVSPVVGNTREITNCCLVIHNPTTKDFYLPKRKISERYVDGELRWYWSGNNKTEVISQYAKMWSQLTDDGITNNSAYGYIIHKKYDYDQLQQIIDLLNVDPTSRRAIHNISDPTLNKIKTKDLQCTIALQFLIRDNKLEATVYMRSNDIFFGLPYDYFYFVTVGQYIADALNIEFGKYTHHATSMHVYLRDDDKFEEHNQITNIDVDKIIKEYYNEE